jgi:hypothetical protein
MRVWISVRIRGQGWAQGFVAGMNLSAAAWDPLMEKRSTIRTQTSTFALSRDLRGRAGRTAAP